MRTHYAEYVKHALRFYTESRMNASCEQPHFKTEADKKNWVACQAALNTYSDEEREMFMTLYTIVSPFPEAVMESSRL